MKKFVVKFATQNIEIGFDYPEISNVNQNVQKH